MNCSWPALHIGRLNVENTVRAVTKIGSHVDVRSEHTESERKNGFIWGLDVHFFLTPLTNLLLSHLRLFIFGLTTFGLFAFIEVLFAYGNIIFDLRLFYLLPLFRERS